MIVPIDVVEMQSVGLYSRACHDTVAVGLYCRVGRFSTFWLIFFMLAYLQDSKVQKDTKTKHYLNKIFEILGSHLLLNKNYNFAELHKFIHKV